MKKIIIEKYIQDKLDETLAVPVAFISILNTILPNAAFAELKQHGFDFQQLANASKLNEPYLSEAFVSEKGIAKKIVLRLS